MRRLALVTALTTFALIIVGGVVRVSDSGLGCGPAGSGFSGWPFCNGDLVPGINLNSIIEYTHRALAVIVGFMILALFVQAYRKQRDLLPATGALLALVAIQGALGGLTVEENLEELYVAAHLGLAMLLLGLDLHRARDARGTPGGGRATAAGGGGHAASCARSSPAYMAGTRTTVCADYQLGDGAPTPAARSSPPARGSSCPSERRGSWTSI